jgi:N-acetylmuramoyl-L-alanine amidase
MGTHRGKKIKMIRTSPKAKQSALPSLFHPKTGKAKTIEFIQWGMRDMKKIASLGTIAAVLGILSAIFISNPLNVPRPVLAEGTSFPSMNSTIQSSNSNLQDSQSHFDRWAIMNSDNPLIHTKPDENAPIILTAKQGAAFPMIDQQEKWVEIQLGKDQKGWVRASETKKEDHSQEVQSVSIIEGTTLYSGPDFSFTAQSSITPDHVYIPHKVSGQWVQIDSLEAGQSGWVPVTAVQWQFGDKKAEPVAASLNEPLKGKTIVVDPGHGGTDAGAMGLSQKIYERDINLAAGKALAAKLEAAGANVILTRSNNKDYISLAERTKMAKEAHADLFVSIHQNMYPNNPSVAGSITFYYHSTESKRLAEAIEEQVVLNLQSNQADGKVDQNELYVLNHTTIPAVLVEGCYLSNTKELKNSITPDYQEKLSTGIYHGILEYLRGQKI